MIWNIRDHRMRPFRWAHVNVIVENVWHDNACADADQAERDDGRSVTYAELRDTSLHEAIIWAEGAAAKVTLFLYDPDDSGNPD